MGFPFQRYAGWVMPPNGHGAYRSRAHSLGAAGTAGAQ